MNAHPCTSHPVHPAWQLSEDAYACLEEARAQLHLLRTLSMPREAGTTPEDPMPMSRQVFSLCIDQLARKMDEALSRCVWCAGDAASPVQASAAPPPPRAAAMSASPPPSDGAGIRPPLRSVDWVLGIG